MGRRAGAHPPRFYLTCLVAAVAVVAVVVVAGFMVRLNDAVAARARTALQAQRIRILFSGFRRADNFQGLAAGPVTACGA
jgi:hypothetical protein